MNDSADVTKEEIDLFFQVMQLSLNVCKEVVSLDGMLKAVGKQTPFLLADMVPKARDAIECAKLLKSAMRERDAGDE